MPHTTLTNVRTMAHEHVGDGEVRLVALEELALRELVVGAVTVVAVQTLQENRVLFSNYSTT